MRNKIMSEISSLPNRISFLGFCNFIYYDWLLRPFCGFKLDSLRRMIKDEKRVWGHANHMFTRLKCLHKLMWPWRFLITIRLKVWTDLSQWNAVLIPMEWLPIILNKNCDPTIYVICHFDICINKRKWLNSIHWILFVLFHFFSCSLLFIPFPRFSISQHAIDMISSRILSPLAHHFIWDLNFDVTLWRLRSVEVQINYWQTCLTKDHFFDSAQYFSNNFTFNERAE